MNTISFFTTLQSQLAQTHWIEWVAVVFGILQVLLAWRNSVWLYPAGIISTTFSIYLLADVRLYAESFLNLYFLIMSVYGWCLWIKKKKNSVLLISKTTNKEWRISILIIIFGCAILYFVLQKYTSSDVPFWDALVSAMAWSGMWLLAKRKLENWIVLNMSNLFAIPLQFHKNIPLYALLTCFLFIVAIFGYFRWRKLLLLQSNF